MERKGDLSTGGNFLAVLNKREDCRIRQKQGITVIRVAEKNRTVVGETPMSSRWQGHSRPSLKLVWVGGGVF